MYDDSTATITIRYCHALNFGTSAYFSVRKLRSSFFYQFFLTHLKFPANYVWKMHMQHGIRMSVRSVLDQRDALQLPTVDHYCIYARS